MTVSVANKMIQNRAGLSNLGRLALAFIDGGTEWLDWAINDAVSRYDFPDESTFVADVQQGLHLSRLALLPNLKLMVSPVKLMTLGVDDLRTLANAETGNDSALVAAQVKRILASHRLVTQDQLAAGPAFLTELGVADAPVFQFMGFEESLAIQGLLDLPEADSASDPDLRTEAAAFAVQQARTVPEFADYYRTYLIYATKIGAQGDTPGERTEKAQAAVQTLLPQLFGCLDCPLVSGLVAPAEVGAAVTNWHRRGRQIGFARLSEGVLQIVRNTGFKDETDGAARMIVNSYLTTAQSLLSSVPLQRGIMGQDGASCVFPLENTDQEAELQLGSTGTISLRWFRRKTAPPANAAHAAVVN